VSSLRQRRAEVGGAERDYVIDPVGPALAAFRWQALRATGPPIEWPTSAISPTATGHARTSCSSTVATDRPFSEMCGPVL
jgi:hypothetical protein